jgi:hypothetical protein
MLACTSQRQCMGNWSAELSCEHALWKHPIQHLLYGVTTCHTENMTSQNWHPHLWEMRSIIPQEKGDNSQHSEYLLQESSENSEPHCSTYAIHFAIRQDFPLKKGTNGQQKSLLLPLLLSSRDCYILILPENKDTSFQTKVFNANSRRWNWHSHSFWGSTSMSLEHMQHTVNVVFGLSYIYCDNSLIICNHGQCHHRLINQYLSTCLKLSFTQILLKICAELEWQSGGIQWLKNTVLLPMPSCLTLIYDATLFHECCISDNRYSICHILHI